MERDPCKRITSAEGLKHTWLNSALSRQASHPGLLIERLRAFTEMSKLQGLLMNVIAKNMSTEGIGALQDVFDALVSTASLCEKIKPINCPHHRSCMWR